MYDIIHITIVTIIMINDNMACLSLFDVPKGRSEPYHYFRREAQQKTHPHPLFQNRSA